MNVQNAPKVLQNLLKDLDDPNVKSKILQSYSEGIRKGSQSSNSTFRNSQITYSDVATLKFLKFILATFGIFGLYLFLSQSQPNVTTKSLFPSTDTNSVIKTEVYFCILFCI